MTVEYLLKDRLGSVDAVANSSGTSGRAISPSDPDSGSKTARLPACQPRSGSTLA